MSSVSVPVPEESPFFVVFLGKKSILQTSALYSYGEEKSLLLLAKICKIKYRLALY